MLGIITVKFQKILNIGRSLKKNRKFDAPLLRNVSYSYRMRHGMVYPLQVAIFRANSIKFYRDVEEGKVAGRIPTDQKANMSDRQESQNHANLKFRSSHCILNVTNMA